MAICVVPSMSRTLPQTTIQREEDLGVALPAGALPAGALRAGLLRAPLSLLSSGQESCGLLCTLNIPLTQNPVSITRPLPFPSVWQPLDANAHRRRHRTAPPSREGPSGPASGLSPVSSGGTRLAAAPPRTPGDGPARTAPSLAIVS